MAEWYYVKGKDRVGPVDEKIILEMIQSQELTSDSYVWTKGYDNWLKIKDLNQFSVNLPDMAPKVLDIPPLEVREIDWDSFSEDERVITIKIGLDRGVDEVEYGPFSLNDLKKAYRESRINGKTLVFIPGMENWKFLSDLPIFQSAFSDDIPIIEESERRQNSRKPFVARMLFHDTTMVYEGICRDISIGGMQVLISNFPGKVGETITMNVHPENSKFCFVASGKIVRVLEGKQGFSLRFDNLSSQAQKAIQNYIDNFDS